MSEIIELKIVGDVHDIGKIGINEDILEKSGRLISEEYEFMKTYSEKGYRIISALKVYELWGHLIYISNISSVNS